MTTRPTDDHHWLALWLLLVGGGLLGLAGVDHKTMFGGMLLGAGFVWLMLVD